MQCLGFQSNGAPSFQEAKALDVNLDIVEAVAEGHRRASRLHQGIVPETSERREYCAGPTLLRFSQKPGGTHENPSMCMRCGQGGAALFSYEWSGPESLGSVRGSLSPGQPPDCSLTEIEPGRTVRLRSGHWGGHHGSGSVHCFSIVVRSIGWHSADHTFQCPDGDPRL